MFLLELAMFAAFAYAGWHAADCARSWLFAILFPLGAMLMWGIFRTPGDMPESKQRIFPTPGPVRLILEIGLFVLSGFALWVSGGRAAAETLWTFAALNYILSLSRIRWLLDH